MKLRGGGLERVVVKLPSRTGGKRKDSGSGVRQLGNIGPCWRSV